MTVQELINILQKMPQHIEVEVNDNLGGGIYFIDCVDHFPDDEDGACVIIQVNV